MRNATTDSPWPLSNNPGAKYNRPEREFRNLDIPLWQLVRASTAAPTFFPPEVIDIGGGKSFVFVDGGVTMFNNPAFQLFLMATLEPYNLGWATGEEQMLLVSIGTGTNPRANEDLQPGEMNLLYNAGSIPSALMGAALNEQDMLCRVFGRRLVGDLLDREVGDLAIDAQGPSSRGSSRTSATTPSSSREGLDAPRPARHRPGRRAAARLDRARRRAPAGRARGRDEGQARAFRGLPGLALAAPDEVCRTGRNRVGSACRHIRKGCPWRSRRTTSSICRATSSTSSSGSSPAGEIPNGDADGKVLVGSENDDVSDNVAWIAKTLAWKGKVFNREKGDLKNKILPFGIKAVRAKVYKEASWFDGEETIVLDYSKTSFFARKVRDEIREVAPGLFLGLVYWKKDKVLHFSLDFGQ